MDQHQQTSRHPKSSQTVETSHWMSSNLDSVPLHSYSRLQTLIYKWNAKITFIWKQDFGPLSNGGSASQGVDCSQESPRSDIFRKRATKSFLKQKHRQKHLTWAKEKKNWARIHKTFHLTSKSSPAEYLAAHCLFVLGNLTFVKYITNSNTYLTIISTCCFALLKF